MRRRFDTCDVHDSCVTETNEDTLNVTHHDSEAQPGREPKAIKVAVGRRFDARVYGAAVITSLILETVLRRVL